MEKEILLMHQTICIMILFIFGSSVVAGVDTFISQDSWIALILATIFVIPIILVYSRIIKLFPGKDIFDIVIELFGVFVGKIIILLITWYALHLGSMVIRTFSEFVEISAMHETPQLPIMISIMLIAVYLVMSGIETFGKWSVFALIIIILIVLFTIFISFGYFDLKNFLPIMDRSIEEVITASFKIVSFPFAETLLLLTISDAIRPTDSPYKIFFYSILFGALILGVVIFRNVAIMGPALLEDSYFPSYTATRIVGYKNFFERIESSISYNFVLAGIVKITVCLFASVKGFAKIFNLEIYKHILIPVSLLMLAVSSIVSKNVTDMFDFIDIYMFYAIPFQLIIPLLIWFTAEIKTHKKKAKSRV